ncbi:MAG: DNA polymerase III subunit beta [Nevskia sp.]|nr:DNA polymerase III subunit beta [Nevskia sp.]
MNIQIPRGELLSALQSVIGVVERRQSLPILSNILLVAQEDELVLTATDLELQVERRVQVQNLTPGRTTAPARKLHDICRGLPEGATIGLELNQNRLQLKSGRSRFTLSTLDPGEFPSLNGGAADITLTVTGKELKELLQRTQFAMAQQDVRYYLNGLLLELRANRVRTVATDGHRLAMAELRRDTGVKKDAQVILPRKTVLELQRLLEADDAEVRINLSSNQVQVDLDGLKLTSKLIEGRFPDYERVIPEGSDKTVHGERARVRAALSRAAILSNEKFRGVRLQLSNGTLRIQTQNPEQEEAEEEVEVQYSGQPLEIGFNVGYLLDALDAIEGNEFIMELRSSDASGLVYDAANNANKYVVMPMRL